MGECTFECWSFGIQRTNESCDSWGGQRLPFILAAFLIHFTLIYTTAKGWGVEGGLTSSGNCLSTGFTTVSRLPILRGGSWGKTLKKNWRSRNKNLIFFKWVNTAGVWSKLDSPYKNKKVGVNFWKAQPRISLKLRKLTYFYAVITNIKAKIGAHLIFIVKNTKYP